MHEIDGSALHPIEIDLVLKVDISLPDNEYLLQSDVFKAPRPEEAIKDEYTSFYGEVEEFTFSFADLRAIALLNITEEEYNEVSIFPAGLEVKMGISNLTTIVGIEEIDTSEGKGFATLTLLADGI